MLGRRWRCWSCSSSLPIGVAAYESFFSWDLLTDPRFVGVGNYRALAAHGELLRVALRTLGYSASSCAARCRRGSALALLLDRPGRWFAFVRASVFSAYVVSWVAVALLWMWILDPTPASPGASRGPSARRSFRCSGVPAGPSRLWPRRDVEAHRLRDDRLPRGLAERPTIAVRGRGARRGSRRARLRHVTLPLLAPTAAFVATTTLVTSFQAFDIVRIMTQGGPARATELFVYAIYEQIFFNLSVGRASALTVVFFALLLAAAVLQLRVWSARGHGAPRTRRRSWPPGGGLPPPGGGSRLPGGGSRR
jgi:ABC-type sugar transport system permease subunit